jgi:N-dimethylarginine dimethylaminohydrolase
VQRDVEVMMTVTPGAVPGGDGFLSTRAYIDRVYPSSPLPPFDDPDELVSLWGRRWGAADEVSPLRAVLMRRPGREFDEMRGGRFDERLGMIVDPDGHWYWDSREQPDPERVRRQHAGLVSALEAEGVEIVFAESLVPPLFNGVFTRDPLVTVRGGAIIGRLAPRQRRGEEASILRVLAEAGMPVLRTVAGTGTVEGGSFVKIRPDVAAFGLSVRCNEEGADQLQEVLVRLGVELIRVPLPGLTIHLDGHLAMLDQETALVNGEGLPYWFLARLEALGIRLLWRHPDERWSVNCIVVRPGRIIMSDSSPRTAELLEQHGIEVVAVAYDEIQKFGGGVHCSTMELVRDW